MYITKEDLDRRLKSHEVRDRRSVTGSNRGHATEEEKVLAGSLALSGEKTSDIEDALGIGKQSILDYEKGIVNGNDKYNPDLHIKVKTAAESIINKNNERKEKIVDLALESLVTAITKVSEGVPEASPKEALNAASQLSKIINDMAPVSSGNTGVRVGVIIQRPNLKKLDDYETVEVGVSR